MVSKLPTMSNSRVAACGRYAFSVARTWHGLAEMRRYLPILDETAMRPKALQDVR